MNMSICRKYRLISPEPAILMSNLYVLYMLNNRIEIRKHLKKAVLQD